MKLYDDIISRVLGILPPEAGRALTPGTPWPEADDHEMILRQDMAYELGSGRLPAIGMTVLTDREDLVPQGGSLLYGQDLDAIHADRAYARIAVVRVRADAMGEGDALYNAIRTLSRARYHSYPKGFMMRVSSVKQRESVRVGRAAIRDGLRFAAVGESLSRQLLKSPFVEAVRILYVTDPGADYTALEHLAAEAEAVTGAIDHIFKNLTMDCHTCSLQKVCDEVEGLRELHFASAHKNA